VEEIPCFQLKALSQGISLWVSDMTSFEAKKNLTDTIPAMKLW